MPSNLVRTAVITAALMAGGGIGYYYGIHLPAREARADAAAGQERCRVLAGAEGEPYRGAGLGGGEYATYGDYQSHYSPEVGACFLLRLTYGSSLTSTTRKERLFVLTDLTSNKRYGAFRADGENAGDIHECGILDRTCASFDEWKALAKPYIGEITQ